MTDIKDNQRAVTDKLYQASRLISESLSILVDQFPGVIQEKDGEFVGEIDGYGKCLEIDITLLRNAVNSIQSIRSARE